LLHTKFHQNWFTRSASRRPYLQNVQGFSSLNKTSIYKNENLQVIQDKKCTQKTKTSLNMLNKNGIQCRYYKWLQNIPTNTVIVCSDILNKLCGHLLNILQTLESHETVAMQLQKHLSFICSTKQFGSASVSET